eukprot:symbB.v1.2.030112.t1/scaffold3358.1/size58492/7
MESAGKPLMPSKVEAAASKMVTMAPDRLEIVASSAAYKGSLAVWDARGFDIPSGRREEYKLRSVFSFTIRAPFLQDADRMCIVESNDVAACGDAYSSVSTLKVQGPTDGKRDMGDSSYSTWDGFAAMTRSQMQQFKEDGSIVPCTEATRVLSRVLLWWLWGVLQRGRGLRY